MSIVLPSREPPPQIEPAQLPACGSADRWTWLQQLRRQPDLDLEPWLVALESGAVACQEDLLAVLADRFDPASQRRVLRWWRLRPDPDPALPAHVMRHRDQATAAWLLDQLAPGPAALGAAFPPAVAAALLPLLGHQRQHQAWPVLVSWLQAPIATTLRRAALEGVARGLSVWPRAALVASLSAVARDLDPQLAADAVDLLARLPRARCVLVPLSRRPLDPSVAQRLGRRLAASPAQPLLLIVHGRSGGEVPAELGALARELEQRRDAPVRLQALSAPGPWAAQELLLPNRGLTLVPLLLLPGGHVRRDCRAIAASWRRQLIGPGQLLQRPFLGAWPEWQRALAAELVALTRVAAQAPDGCQRPLLLHHPIEGALALRYLTHLEHRTGARCVATSYSAPNGDGVLSSSIPALGAASGPCMLPLALAANRLTDSLAAQVGPPLLQRPRFWQLLLAELESLP